MEYNNFISTIKTYQTKWITAIYIPNSCAMTQIPTAFGLMFPSLLEIVQCNYDNLCAKNKIIAVFGLQVSFTPIISDLPELFDRVINDEIPKCHFCCNLDYLAIEPSKLKNIQSWEGSQTIVIDFTTGMVMDSAEYLNKIFSKSDSPGMVYDWLDQGLLGQVWKIVTKSRFRVQV